MNIRGVIFDLGGTLVIPESLEEQKITHLLQWAAARGLPIGPEAVRVIREARHWLWNETFASGRQYTTPQAIARAARQLEWPLDNGFADEAARIYQAPEAACRPFPDAVASLTSLQDLGLRLGIISDASDHWLVEDILTQTGLRPFFDPVVSSAGFGRIKPAPGIFRAVLDRWEYQPQMCVMVGDTLNADIAGAQALGIHTILVTMDHDPWLDGRYPATAAPVHPDASAASLTEVVQIIREWMDLPDVKQPGPPQR